MKLSPRDRWIVAIFPALCALIAYEWGVATPLERELKTLRESAGAADPAKTAQDLTVALRDVHKIETELESEKKNDSLHEAVFPEEWKDTDRTRTLQELSQVFEESGVLMLGSSLQKDRATDGALQELAKGLKERYGAPDPQLWRFELSGTYSRISELLKRLGQSKRFIVPVNVDMKVENDSADLTWTVILWI